MKLFTVLPMPAGGWEVHISQAFLELTKLLEARPNQSFGQPHHGHADEEAPAAPPANPPKRGRGAAVADTPVTQAATNAPPAKPKRGQKGATAAPAANPTGASTATPATRGRTSAAALAAAGKSSASEIKDSDLMKAASEGAAKITPKGVIDILASLGVASVKELKLPQSRQMFLDRVRAAVEAA